MTKKDFLPIILGSDENAYGTARLFYEAYGITPLLICTRQLTAIYNSKILNVITIDGFDSDEVFVNTLSEIIDKQKKAYDKAVIIPCSDYYSKLISKYAHLFDGFIANKFIGAALHEKLSLKDSFYSTCTQYGLDIPKTYIAMYEDRATAPEKFGFSFPVMVKPENSNSDDYRNCSFEGKKKTYFLKNKQDYIELIDRLNKANYREKLIIQEFIEGDDCDLRVINAFSDNNGKVVFMSLGQPLLEEYHPNTLGNYAAIISRYDRELFERIKSFLEGLNYVGFSNIDLKYERKTGKYYMMELNPRPGRSSFYVRSAGINMMKILVDCCVYNKKSDVIFAEKTALWLHVPKCVVYNYLSDKELLAEVKELVKQKKYMYTLYDKKDMSFKRIIKVARYYFAQYNNFKKFYFKKT